MAIEDDEDVDGVPVKVQPVKHLNDDDEDLDGVPLKPNLSQGDDDDHEVDGVPIAFVWYRNFTLVSFLTT